MATIIRWWGLSVY